ncbi:VOC family protein [Solicola gregarius]|uniref:VOC family protein n=1 Tax=Solicola gregarius TaxID=2908642 RepID=A0AA46TLC1_9ACTN|nr:VOC family protein [Solicola gregarius]UYM07248.1 VOC family protein [Solicola gregarius]
MSRMLFVNLPVADLDKSVAFFTALGFEFNADFTDDNATAMVVNEQATVMLLVRDFFSTFTDKSVADASTSAQAILALSADSREDVDQVISKAVEAGGRKPRETKDEGFMYGGAFEDLDGHEWEVMWMDPSAMQG